MDYKSLISNGKSVREFKKKKVAQKYFNEIEDYIKNSKKLLSTISLELNIFNKEDIYSKLQNVAGYNGHMIEAPHYAVILSQVENGYIENSGYIGERLILKSRSLGIDSCWVTFDDSNKIKEKLNISSNKEVTAIIALGYAQNAKLKSKRISDRLGIEEIVYMNEWGNNATIEQLEERGLVDAFSYARMAPSTLNRQPWRFIVDGSNLILAVKKDGFTSDYEKCIDAGIAMLYFGLIIDTTMFNLDWKIGSLDKEYKIDDNYEIMGYCSI